MDKKDEVVKFWLGGAQEDWEQAEEIWKSGKRLYNALFFAQLVLEKILKALHYQTKEGHPLLTHDLRLLAQKLDLPIDENMKEELKKITSFNISARYDDYKLRFRKEATKEFVDLWMKRVELIRNYLLSLFEA